MEKGIGDEVEGAVHVLFDSKVQLQWPSRLVAYWEWHVLELARLINDMLAISENSLEAVRRSAHWPDSPCAIEAAHGDSIAQLVTWLLSCQRLLRRHGTRQCHAQGQCHVQDGPHDSDRAIGGLREQLGKEIALLVILR